MKKTKFKTGLKIFDLFVITILPTAFITIAMIAISEHFFKIDLLKQINDKTIALYIIIFTVGSFLATLQIHRRYVTPVYKIKEWVSQFNNGEYAIPLVRTDLTVFNELIHEIEKLQTISSEEQNSVEVSEQVIKANFANRDDSSICEEHVSLDDKPQGGAAQNSYITEHYDTCKTLQDNKQEIYQKIMETQETLDAMFKNLEGVLYAANHKDGSLTPLKPLFQTSKNNIDLTESIQKTIENLSKKITCIKESVHEAQIISINASLNESAELEYYGEQIKNVIDGYQAELDTLKDNLTALHKISGTLSDGISNSDDLLNKTLASYQGLNIPVNNIKALKLQISHVLQNVNGLAKDFLPSGNFA